MTAKQLVSAGYALAEDDMSSFDESVVSIEQLDDFLKAILKAKLREFVHLNPCFNEVYDEIDRVNDGRHGLGQNLLKPDQPSLANHHRFVSNHKLEPRHRATSRFAI